MKKFNKVSRNLLNSHVADVADEHENEVAMLFEDQECASQLINAQLHAIVSDGCKERVRLAILSSFARSSKENKENLDSFLEHSAKMNIPPTEENRERMYHHVGKWTIEQVSQQQENLLVNFSDAFITEIGTAIYSASVMAGVQCKLIK